MADSDRIANLEQVVRQLRGEVAELREMVQHLSAMPHGDPGPESAPPRPAADPRPASVVPTPSCEPVSPSATPRPPRSTGPAAWPALEQLDLESLIGRYGTIALATLTIIVGAGAFLTWAIANGKLGPHVRLVIGAVVAIAVAALGLRLRTRGASRFGNVLLGLALALAHVEAWGAGPSLHVVSAGVALAIAAIASSALATLALAIDEQSLFAVGLGGALLAPFVVSEGRGNVFVLLAYGLVVIGLGLYVMRPRAWALASWLMVLGCLVYAAAALDIASVHSGWRYAFAPAIFALCCAWCASGWGGARQRRSFVLGYLGIVLLAYVAALAPATTPLAIVLGVPLAATVTAYLIAQLDGLTPPARLVAAVGLPLGLFGAAWLISSEVGGAHGATLSAIWTVVACAAAWDADAEMRAWHLMVAGVVSLAGILSALHAEPLLLAVVLAAHAVLFAFIFRVTRGSAVLIPVAGALAVAITMAFVQLLDRPAYGYTPFLTAPSAAALAVAVACWLVWHQARRALERGDEGAVADVRTQTAVLAACVTFFWGRAELSRAYSQDIAIFLLVLYYALVGVGAISLGRRRALRAARFTGLALAIYAALKAVLRAWDYGAVGFKVGSCALAGAFLLAVAYWYRAKGEEAARE